MWEKGFKREACSRSLIKRHRKHIYTLKPGREELAGPKGLGLGMKRYMGQSRSREVTKENMKHPRSTKSGLMIVTLKPGVGKFLSLLVSGEVAGEMTGLKKGPPKSSCLLDSGKIRACPSTQRSLEKAARSKWSSGSEVPRGLCLNSVSPCPGDVCLGGLTDPRQGTQHLDVLPSEATRGLLV